MQLINSDLDTPIYLKMAEDEPWPEDKMFYLLTANGLFLCRNHPWFKSCAPATKGPSGLAEQKASLTLDYPVIPRALVEKAVAFFRRIYDKEQWESALIIAFNRQTQQIELICPDQKASWASVHYTIPTLPQHMALIGDFHSHCDFSPTPSMTDENDEMNRAGLHLIAGFLKDPKPKFHCIVVADGTRFTVENHGEVMEIFESDKGIEVPLEWIDRVKEKKYSHSSSYSRGGYSYQGDYGDGGSSHWWKRDKPAKEDKDIINKTLSELLAQPDCPQEDLVRTRLVINTSVRTSYAWCSDKAKKFVKHWNQQKSKYDKEHPPKQVVAA